MKKTIAFAAGIIFAAAPFFAQTSYSESDLVWKDDFDGNSLNLDDWNYEYHEPGWVNNELQEYVDSKENIYVKDGNLVIQAVQKKARGGKTAYTSGRINTKGKHDFKYGRIEARIKFPSGRDSSRRSG
ncbi:MAG: glycoside hydrolase family 16 protein [Treponema succinifaciens]|nr:MAG: glycoside hydrolase family 16 protein [Treponema succinifaciens]